MNNTPVSIVIITYFRPELLKKVLESAINLNYPKNLMEIITVIDNNDLEAIKVVKDISMKYNIDIKIIKDDLKTASKARNIGIKKARNDIVVLVDDDVALNSDTLIKTLPLLSNNQKIAAIGFPCISDTPSLGEKLHHWRYIDIITDISTTMPVTIFRKSILLRIGLYREDMGPPISIHEDWELGSRIRKKGYRVIVNGQVIQYHMLSLRSKINKININKHNKTRFNSIISYIKSYIDKHWWSFFEVLKSSPISQIIEYILYYVIPIVLMISLIINPLYTLAMTLLILLYLEVNSFMHGYYKKLTIKERLLYPLLLTTVRIIRSYLSLIGYIKNKLIIKYK